MDRRKLYYYRHIVKRHLSDIKERIRLSENDMERSYYQSRFAAQLSIYAEALAVKEEYLERYIR